MPELLLGAPRGGPSTCPGCSRLQDAGVDTDAGNELVERIKKINPNIGGFSGLFPFGDSYLVSGTDGERRRGVCRRCWARGAATAARQSPPYSRESRLRDAVHPPPPCACAHAHGAPRSQGWARN